MGIIRHSAHTEVILAANQHVIEIAICGTNYLGIIQTKDGVVAVNRNVYIKGVADIVLADDVPRKFLLGPEGRQDVYSIEEIIELISFNLNKTDSTHGSWLELGKAIEYRLVDSQRYFLDIMGENTLKVAS